MHGTSIIKHAVPNQQGPSIAAFFDKQTNSVQYVVACLSTGRCAIIDPVLNFDERAGAIGSRAADEILAHIADNKYQLEWILDTHPHADHFSAAHYLKQKTGAPIAIGERVKGIQKIWTDLYNLPDVPTDGSQWDRLFRDNEIFKIGNLDVTVLLTPGHTLASVSYLIGDVAFVHDTIFMPDSGTARADFPGGSARDLWLSIQRILALPEHTRLFVGHDYMPGGRQPQWVSTVGQQKRSNVHIAGKTESEFIALREERDRALSMPKLMLYALQANICGGRLPKSENNGRRYLKIPIGVLDNAAWREGC
jgi:glyoxylase-like metal-dependent hydrolase (beta-lactamase superfamily II)